MDGTFSNRGFHVRSHQANFASKSTCNRHVSFLKTRSGIGENNKMPCYFLFSSYLNTKLQLSGKNNGTHNRSKF